MLQPGENAGEWRDDLKMTEDEVKRQSLSYTFSSRRNGS